MSFELTRKDRLAINIKKMQNKYSKTYFNFIPETFVLPDEYDQFEEYFKFLDAKLGTKNDFVMDQKFKPFCNNLWICKPSCSSQGKGIFLVDKLK